MTCKHVSNKFTSRVYFICRANRRAMHVVPLLHNPLHYSALSFFWSLRRRRKMLSRIFIIWSNLFEPLNFRIRDKICRFYYRIWTKLFKNATQISCELRRWLFWQPIFVLKNIKGIFCSRFSSFSAIKMDVNYTLQW